MEFQLQISVTDNSVQQSKISLVYSFSSELNNFFENKQYGNDVSKIEVGFLMVLERPGFENWYKEKPPKYIEYKSTRSKLTGEEIIKEKNFSYEIKLNEEELSRFSGGDDQLSKTVLIAAILKSFSKFDKLTKKVSFDKERFKADLESFLDNNN